MIADAMTDSAIVGRMIFPPACWMFPQACVLNDQCVKRIKVRTERLEHDPEKWEPVFEKIMLEQKDHAPTMSF